MADVKAYLRIDGSEEDAVLASLIAAARMYVENYQRRAYGCQQLRLTLSAQEAGQKIELPRSKRLVSVDKAAAVLEDNSEEKLSYSICCGDINSCLALDGEPAGDVCIEYTVDGGACCSSTLLAMQLLVSGWYENRLPFAADGKTLAEMPFGVTALLQGERLLL